MSSEGLMNPSGLVSKLLMCCSSHQQGHMKTHPAALPNTPSKAQTNDTDIVEDRSKSTTTKNRVQKEEEQGLAKSPEKGDGTDPLPPIGVVSSVADEPMDTTV